MEINIWIVLGILAIHWVADFVCQTPFQAENKSKNWNALLSHTATYSGIWWIPCIILIQHVCPEESQNWILGHSLLFILITFICHTATDYYTSRVNSVLWEKKAVHEFFCSIGMDQLLHYIQLILTFYYLTR